MWLLPKLYCIVPKLLLNATCAVCLRLAECMDVVTQDVLQSLLHAEIASLPFLFFSQRVNQTSFPVHLGANCCLVWFGFFFSKLCFFY